MDANPFAKMQRLGRALMLPIAVLPVAGLLLRLGQPDVFNIKMIADAGDAIFSNLPLLFAIGVAVGFAKDNNGTAGLAGAIGYLIEIAVMKDINRQAQHGRAVGDRRGYAWRAILYNRYKDIKLPEYLAFFGGKRFVPIVTGVACLVLGIVFGYVWQPVQHAIDAAGLWLTDGRRTRRVRVRRAEPDSARDGSAPHHQLARVVRVRHVHAPGRRRSGDGRPASLLRGRSDRGRLHDRLLPDHDVRLAGSVSRDVPRGAEGPSRDRRRPAVLDGADLVPHGRDRADRIHASCSSRRCSTRSTRC